MITTIYYDIYVWFQPNLNDLWAPADTVVSLEGHKTNKKNPTNISWNVVFLFFFKFQILYEKTKL